MKNKNAVKHLKNSFFFRRFSDEKFPLKFMQFQNLCENVFLLILFLEREISASFVFAESIVFYNEWLKSIEIFTVYASPHILTDDTSASDDAITVPLPLLPILPWNGSF